MKLTGSMLLYLTATLAYGGDFSYQAVASRHGEAALTDEKVAEARMQGECLVGLKNLNFRKKEDFDPVAEWTNYRSISLLEQYSPCEVLIMLEIAQKELRSGNGTDR